MSSGNTSTKKRRRVDLPHRGRMASSRAELPDSTETHANDDEHLEAEEVEPPLGPLLRRRSQM